MRFTAKTASLIATVSFAVALVAAAPSPATAQTGRYIARCDECKEHLGGRGYIGPFDDEATCESYRRAEAAQGFNFDPCLPLRPGQSPSTAVYRGPPPPLGARAAVLSFTMGTVGALTGWAFSDPADQIFNARQGAVAGGCVGWLFALATQGPDTPKGQQPIDAMLAGVSAAAIAYEATALYSTAPPEERQQQAVAAAAVGFTGGALVSITMGKKLSSGLRAWGDRHGLRGRFVIIPSPNFGSGGGSGISTIIGIRW